MMREKIKHSVELESDVVARLERFCRTTGCAKAAAIRAAIQDGIKLPPPPESREMQALLAKKHDRRTAIETLIIEGLQREFGPGSARTRWQINAGWRRRINGGGTEGKQQQ